MGNELQTIRNRDLTPNRLGYELLQLVPRECLLDKIREPKC